MVRKERLSDYTRVTGQHAITLSTRSGTSPGDHFGDAQRLSLDAEETHELYRYLHEVLDVDMSGEKATTAKPTTSSKPGKTTGATASCPDCGNVYDPTIATDCPVCDLRDTVSLLGDRAGDIEQMLAGLRADLANDQVDTDAVTKATRQQLPGGGDDER